MTREHRAKTRSGGVASWRVLGLLRYPRLFTALVVGASLLVAAISAYPLFLSAAASEVMASEIATPLVSRYGVGVGYRSTNVDLAHVSVDGRRTYEVMDDAFRRLVEESPDLGPPLRAILGPNVTASSEAGERAARLFSRTGALDHVRVLAGDRDSAGAWIPDLVAGATGSEPGDRLTLTSQDGTAIEVDVAGVYAGLYAEPRRSYWQQWGSDIYPSFAHCDGPCREPVVPPQFVLLDHGSLLDAMTQLEDTTATVAWQAPLAPGGQVTLERGRRVAAFAEQLRLRMGADDTQAGRLFDCCKERKLHIREPRETSFSSLMGDVVSRAEERIAAVAVPGRVLQWTMVLVALAVLAAAGTFAVGARPTETRLRFARGMGPTSFGLRTSSEAVVPCLVGAGAGLVLALLGVLLVGPEGAIERGALANAAVSALVAAIPATLAIGVVATLSFLRLEARDEGARWISRVPWEVLPLGLAWLSYQRLTTQGPLESIGGIDRPRPEVLLFPLLFILGGAGLAARGIRLLAGILRRRWVQRPVALLAVQRLARASGLAVALVAAATLSLGVLLHSQAVVRSLQDTIDTKSTVYVGSDVAAAVNRETEVPEDFPLPATKVTRRNDAGTLAGSGVTFDLLAIDPETFAEAAFWREEFSRLPLEGILERLREPGAAMRVAIAGEAPQDIPALERAGVSTPIEVVARAEVFPGAVGTSPLVVVDAATLDRAFEVTSHPFTHPAAESSIWIRGGTSDAIDSLSLLPSPPHSTITVDQVRDLPAIKALIQSMVVLNGLGLASAVLILVGMLMYLQARQRGQLVAYGLSVRMGLAPASYRRSIAVELGGMLAAALVAGALTGVAAGFVVNRLVDPLGSIPPDPQFRLPLLPIGLAVIGLCLVAWIGAWWAGRTAARSAFGEVMRVAG